MGRGGTGEAATATKLSTTRPPGLRGTYAELEWWKGCQPLSGRHNMCGDGVFAHDTCVPLYCDMYCPVQVADIAAGGWHSCALSSAGEVYVWGRGEYGRLGLGDRSGSSKLRPHKVRGLESHVVVQVRPTRVRVRVKGTRVRAVTYSLRPHKVRGLESHVVVQVRLAPGQSVRRPGPKSHNARNRSTQPAPSGKACCGTRPVAALCTAHVWCKLHMSGVNCTCATRRSGQRPPLLCVCPRPQVSAGGTHTMALTSSARLFIWGRGAFGRLGMSDDKVRAVYGAGARGSVLRSSR